MIWTAKQVSEGLGRLDWNLLRSDGRMGQPETMNTEITTLIAFGVALLGLQDLLFRWLRQHIQALRRDPYCKRRIYP